LRAEESDIDVHESIAHETRPKAPSNFPGDSVAPPMRIVP